jgi:hypothetical protein
MRFLGVVPAGGGASLLTDGKLTLPFSRHQDFPGTASWGSYPTDWEGDNIQIEAFGIFLRWLGLHESVPKLPEFNSRGPGPIFPNHMIFRNAS